MAEPPGFDFKLKTIKVKRKKTRPSILDSIE